MGAVAALVRLSRRNDAAGHDGGGDPAEHRMLSAGGAGGQGKRGERGAKAAMCHNRHIGTPRSLARASRWRGALFLRTTPCNQSGG